MEHEYITHSATQAIWLMFGVPQFFMAMGFIFFFGYYVFVGMWFALRNYDSRRQFYLDLIPGRLWYRGIRSMLREMGE